MPQYDLFSYFGNRFCEIAYRFQKQGVKIRCVSLSFLIVDEWNIGLIR
jgi:hypothetical protein